MRPLLCAALALMALPLVASDAANAKPKEIVVVGSTIKPVAKSSPRRIGHVKYSDLTFKRGVMQRPRHSDFLWRPRR